MDEKKRDEDKAQLPDLDRGGETGRDYEEEQRNVEDRKRMAEGESDARRTTDAEGDDTYTEEARPDEVAGAGKGLRGEEKDQP